MSAEEKGEVSRRLGITLPERIVIVNVYIAVIVFVIWYAFFAGSPGL
jgi:hypothetical protein